MIKYKNIYLNIGLLLWGFVSIILHGVVAANNGTNISIAPILINLSISYYLVQTDWINRRFVEKNNSRVKLIIVGISFSFVIFIIQSILGAIVFA